MSDETTLLPCPFCGGEARLVNDYSSEKGMSYQIWHECMGHGGRSSGYGQGVKPFFETPWYATDAEAIAAWNTRHVETCELSVCGWGNDTIQCMACGAYWEHQQFDSPDYYPVNYCPNCGAKILQGVDNADK